MTDPTRAAVLRLAQADAADASQAALRRIVDRLRDEANRQRCAATHLAKVRARSGRVDDGRAEMRGYAAEVLDRLAAELEAGK